VEVYLTQLWKERQDFQLILTNPSAYDYIRNYEEKYPFVHVHTFTREEYLEALWRADIVVGCHSGINQWSLAVTEALAADCVPLLNDEGFFKELLLESLPLKKRAISEDKYFYHRSNFCRKINALLDNLSQERIRAKAIGRHIRHFYNWGQRIEDWIKAIDGADNASPLLKDATSITRKIDQLMKSHGSCSKRMILQTLQWHPKSRYISWTRYRRYMRQKYIEGWGPSGVTFSCHAPSKSGRLLAKD
jgi:hypothetical protein